MGVGVIGRDHMGQILATYCDVKPYVIELEVAEAWAA